MSRLEISKEIKAQVVDMYMVDGMKEQEIAESTGLSVHEVHTILDSYENGDPEAEDFEV